MKYIPLVVVSLSMVCACLVVWQIMDPIKIDRSKVDLVLLRTAGERADVHRVSGVIRNNSSRAYDSARVSVYFYDLAGQQVDSVVTIVRNLAARDTAVFRAASGPGAVWFDVADIRNAD